MMNDFFRNKGRWFLPLLTGLLGALSLDIPYLWPLVFVSLIPLLYFIRISRSYIEAFLGGWLAGCVLIGGTLIWFWETLPLNWLGIEGGMQGVYAVFLAWGVLVTVPMALSVGLWAACTRRFNSTASHIFLAPLLWTLAEYGRGWIFAFVTYGEGTVLGSHFSAGFLGYALAHHPLLLQLASLGGIYLLSAVVVFFNQLLARFLILGRVRIIPAMVLSGVLILTSFVSVHGREEGRALTIAAFHTDFPPSLSLSSEEEDRRERIYRKMLLQAASSSPDVIILPEDSRFLSRIFVQGDEEEIVALLRKPTLIIDSGRTEIEGASPVQRMLYWDTSEKLPEFRDKSFLVPQGEYVPKLFEILAGGMGISLEETKKNRAYHRGASMTVGETPDGIKVGALFCSEILSPSLHREARMKGAQILVNVSSTAWFHGSYVLNGQLRAVAKVRAVEQRLPLVVAANGAPSLAVDRYGNIPVEEEGKEKILFLKGFF